MSLSVGDFLQVSYSVDGLFRDSVSYLGGGLERRFPVVRVLLSPLVTLFLPACPF